MKLRAKDIERTYMEESYPYAMKVTVTYTDTFSGEVNGAWSRRAVLFLPSEIALKPFKRAIKAAVGLAGVRGSWDNCDGYRFKPYNSNTILYTDFD